jgi:hypothetical protein
MKRVSNASSFGELLSSATTYIKKRVLPCGNVPLSIPQLGVELGHQYGWIGLGILPFIWFLRDASHIGHDALVELSHYFVLKEVAALNLTSNFVFFSVASVDAHHVGETFGVGYAFQEGKLTFGKEAANNFTRIRGCLTGKWCC